MKENKISIGFEEAVRCLNSLEEIIHFSTTKLKGKVNIILEDTSFDLFKNKLLNEFLNYNNKDVEKESLEFCNQVIIKGKYNTVEITTEAPIKNYLIITL